MLIFKFKPTLKSIPWFEDHKIDLRAMEMATTLLFAELEPTQSVRIKKLTIQVLYGAICSDYTFTTDKIRLCELPDYTAKSLTRKKHAIFTHFLHEFRHWMQSRVYKVSASKIDYNDDDVERNTHAYSRNEYEVDARQFERTYLKKFYKYYKTFRLT